MITGTPSNAPDTNPIRINISNLHLKNRDIF